MDHPEKFQINNPPPQSLGLWFSECQQKWNINISHYEKIENWPPFHKYQSYGKNLYYLPPVTTGNNWSCYLAAPILF